MSTPPPLQLAVLDPGDMSEQVQNIAQDARHQLDWAWRHLNEEGDINKANGALVVADERIRELQAFGEAATAAIQVLQQDRQILEAQRDEAVQGKVQAEERADDAEEHAERLIENMDEMVADRIDEEAAYIEQAIMDDLDYDQIADEIEESLDIAVTRNIGYLRAEGDLDIADRLEQEYGAYQAAQEALTSSMIGVSKHLIECSNARRRAAGQETMPYYSPPPDYYRQANPIQGEDDGEGDDELEADIDGGEFDDEDDAA